MNKEVAVDSATRANNLLVYGSGKGTQRDSSYLASQISSIILRCSSGSDYFRQQEVKDEKSTARILQMKEKYDAAVLSGVEAKKVDQEVERMRRMRPKRSHKVVVDMDSFYYSCAIAKHVEEGTPPTYNGAHLNDMPVVVGGGMILTSNYEARKFGVRSAMAGFIADRLVNELSKGKIKLLHLPSDYQYYNAKSSQVRNILTEYDPDLKQYSLDEFYMDVTGYLDRKDVEEDVEGLMEKIRERVRLECHLTCSAGIAPSSVLAKICSDLNKPNGQYFLAPGDSSVMNFLESLECRKVPGVGRVAQKELAAFEITTVGHMFDRRYDLFKIFKPATANFMLRASVGGWGGKGEEEEKGSSFGAGEDKGQKGISIERTFGAVWKKEDLEEKLDVVCSKLEDAMKRKNLSGRRVTLKVKLANYVVFSRSKMGKVHTNDKDDVCAIAKGLTEKVRKEVEGREDLEWKVRLIGVRVDEFEKDKGGGIMNFFGAVKGGEGEKIEEGQEGQAEDDEEDGLVEDDDDVILSLSQSQSQHDEDDDWAFANDLQARYDREAREIQDRREEVVKKEKKKVTDEELARRMQKEEDLWERGRRKREGGVGAEGKRQKTLLDMMVGKK